MVHTFEHGWRFAVGTDPMHVERELRVAGVRAYQDLLKRAILTRAVQMLDIAWLQGLPRPVRPLADAFQHLLDLQRLDRVFSLEVIFVRDMADRFEGTERLYALLYDQGHYAYRHLLSDIPGTESWAYSDHRKRPEGVTEVQWRTRQRTWTRLFRPETAMADQGLTFRLLSSDYLPRPVWLDHLEIADPGLSSYIPDVLTRATTVARKELAESISRDRLMVSTSEIVASMDELTRRLPSRVTQIAELLEPLTIDDLRSDQEL